MTWEEAVELLTRAVEQVRAAGFVVEGYEGEGGDVIVIRDDAADRMEFIEEEG